MNPGNQGKNVSNFIISILLLTTSALSRQTIQRIDTHTYRCSIKMAFPMNNKIHVFITLVNVFVLTCEYPVVSVWYFFRIDFIGDMTMTIIKATLRTLQWRHNENQWHRKPPATPRIIQLFINTLRPRQNSRFFPDDIFKCIFLNENVWISIKISLKFVPKGPINNILPLV